MTLYVRKITLTNVRQFEKRTFSFNPGFNLLVGENGAGKSTLIQSLAVVFAKSRQSSRRATLEVEDIKLHSSMLNISSEISTTDGQLVASPTYQRVLGSRARRRGNYDSFPVFWYGSNEALCRHFVGRRLKKYDGHQVDGLDGLADQEVWIYRSIGQVFERRDASSHFGKSEDIQKFIGKVLAGFSESFRGFDWVFVPYACSVLFPKDAPEGLDADFGAHEAIENAIMRHFQELGNPFEWIDRPSVELNSKGQVIGFEKEGAIIPPLGEIFKRLRLSRKFLSRIEEIVVNVRLSPRIRVLKSNGDSFLLKQLSDGEQRLFSIFVDIARQLSLQPSDLSLDRRTALILIDEIDVHLHPKWQRLIVPALEDLFPACQFIATTHSPFVVQAVREENVQHLDHELLGGFSNRGIEEIAVKVMDVEDPEVSKRYLEMLDSAKAYFSELDKIENNVSESRFDERRSEQVARLKLQMNRLARKYAWNPAYQAFLELRTEAKLEGGNNQ